MTYHYRITAEKLDLPEGDEPVGCSVTVSNHDDLVPLIEKVKSLNVLPDAEVARFVIGLFPRPVPDRDTECRSPSRTNGNTGRSPCFDVVLCRAC